MKEWEAELEDFEKQYESLDDIDIDVSDLKLDRIEDKIDRYVEEALEKGAEIEVEETRDELEPKAKADQPKEIFKVERIDSPSSKSFS